MSTIEKNILKIQKELSSKEQNSRSYNKFLKRLRKKYNEVIRFKKVRAREESLHIANLLSNGIVIKLDKNYKLTQVVKNKYK